MKRLLVVTLLLALLAVPGVAAAYDPGQALPAGATEVEAWRWDGAQWVSMSTGGLTSEARCWTSGPTSGACNKENWPVNVTAHASVAQWVDWTLSGTRWDWRVRKPGTYAADCITFTLKSNNDVFIDYEGFGDLVSVTGNSVNPNIATAFGFGPTIGQVQFVSGDALNTHDDLVPDSDALHAGLSCKLWIKITVVECNSSCEYEDTATVTLKLKNIKMWIDPATGNFLS